MRILHIDTGAEMRGGQRQVLLLMDQLRQAGHDVLLLATQGSPLWNSARLAEYEIYPATLRELWQRSKDVSLVHAHDARAHAKAAIAARCRFVVSRRVAFPIKRSLASAWKYRRAARYLAVSACVAAELQAAGIASGKVDVVYDAVDPVTCAQPWDARSPVVVPASRDPQKGRDLVEAAARLAGVAVVFSDTIEDDLRQASMLIYATRSEGLGSAVILAMSMGVPVIASRVGGLREVFVDGVSGVFVSNEPQDIAAAIHRVRGDPEFARALVRHGKQRVAECFTKRQLLERTLASYETMLAGDRR
jgi:glycosyltransferase involved in cell wall biosynthesis